MVMVEFGQSRSKPESGNQSGRHETRGMETFFSSLVTSLYFVTWSTENVKIRGSLTVLEKGSPKKKAKAIGGRTASAELGLIASKALTLGTLLVTNTERK